ncbi:hypothetical protein FDUTEX481_00172 [Tolypothrix sp. PCC 7601]|nr:hypothetical protein FDUTEX481_00172 [Tolypothrix sp. PCC 7601]
MQNAIIHLIAYTRLANLITEIGDFWLILINYYLAECWYCLNQ